MDSTKTDVTVTYTVDGIETDKQQETILDLYCQNMETFLCKNDDYGGSFENSAKVESVLKHGEVRDAEIPDLVSKQIFVRGLMDKVSRFYQLEVADSTQRVDDEQSIDTLLDMANYAVMLASVLERYDEGPNDE